MLKLSSRLLIVTDRHQTKERPLIPLLQRVLTAAAPAIQLRERDLSARELVTRAREMRRAGAFGVAVVTAVLGAADVESATRELLDAVTFLP